MIAQSDDENESAQPQKKSEKNDMIDACPQCGHPMIAVRGLKSAICQNCGLKDSCCY